jgi:hypothetical protein
LCSDVIWLTGAKARSGHSKLIELGLYDRLGDLLVEYSAQLLKGQVLVALKGGDAEDLCVDEDAEGFCCGFRRLAAGRGD